jgi:hypothetical protein
VLQNKNAFEQTAYEIGSLPQTVLTSFGSLSFFQV